MGRGILIFTGSSGDEFYKSVILPSGSEDGSFGFLILGRAPELWFGANGTNVSKFAILAVPVLRTLFSRPEFNR